MTKVILIVSALALAPVAALADHGFGSAAAQSGSASVQCVLDPAACTTVERSISRR